jgi:hypothetical protein
MKTTLHTESATSCGTKSAAQNTGRLAIRAIGIAAGMLMLLNSLPATAGTVESYTGNEFQSEPGARILITLTLKDFIQPNTEYFFSDLESGGITDTNAFYINFVGHPLNDLPLRHDLYFETDGAANIVEWEIPDVPPAGEQNIGSYFVPGKSIQLDADQTGGSFVAGTWQCVSGCFSASEAPEPSSWSLPLFGSAVLWLVRRRKTLGISTGRSENRG